MTQYTPNYHLPLYEDSDKPNLRDQYNLAINTIDTQLENINTDNTTTQNLISGINSDISTIKGDVSDIESDIATLSSESSKHATDIANLSGSVSSLSSDVSDVETKSETNTTNIATQAAYWMSLGVSNVDDAASIKSDINTLKSSNNQNTSDIATIKATQIQQSSTLASHTGEIQNLNNDVDTINENIQTLSNEFDRTIAKGWQVTEAPSTIAGKTETCFVFLNPAKNAMKLAFSISLTTAQLNANLVEIPGYSNAAYRYGVKLFNLSNIVDIESALVYAYPATHQIQSTGATNMVAGGINLAIGSDGYLYYDPKSNNSQYGSAITQINIWCTQTLLSLTNYDLSPVVPTLE